MRTNETHPLGRSPLLLRTAKSPSSSLYQFFLLTSIIPSPCRFLSTPSLTYSTSPDASCLPPALVDHRPSFCRYLPAHTSLSRDLAILGPKTLQCLITNPHRSGSNCSRRCTSYRRASQESLRNLTSYQKLASPGHDTPPSALQASQAENSAASRKRSLELPTDTTSL